MPESNWHQMLLEAVKQDDVNYVSTYLSTCPQLFITLKENPLLLACTHGSHRVAEKIARRYPEFARVKNSEGRTALHLACSKGHQQLVEHLLDLDPKLCLEKDSFSMNPLHIAIKYGHGDVIRALIVACPEAIQTVTSQRDTVFLLAAKSYQPNAFAVLLQEIQRLKLEHLLHRKDRQGNNVLHIAASNKLIEVVELLLPQGSTTRPLVRVNTTNKKGFTALDLYYQSCRDIATQDIERILCESGALEGRLLPLRAHIRSTLETKNVVLVVLGLVTGAAFTTVCNLPGSFLKHHLAAGAEFHAGDIISGQLPPIFYLMVFNTSILIVCLVAIVVLLWPLPYRPVVLFVTITIGIVYALLVKNIVPKFLFRVGSHKIFGGCMVQLLAVAFICCGAITYYTISSLCRFTKCVIQSTRGGNALSWFRRCSILSGT